MASSNGDASTTDTPEASEHRSIAERLIDGRSGVGQLAVSPNGQHVAYVVATTDLAKNTTRARIWLDGSPMSQGDFDANPTWSPDGRFLAFTSRRGESKGDATLHVMPIAGPGEVRTVCTLPEGIGAVSWSPDGKWLAFNSRTQDPRYQTKDVSWQAPRKVERFFSRLNGEGWVFDRPTHVYVIAADGTQNAPRNLTPGEFEHGGTAWLADSSGLLTTSQRGDDYDRTLASDLFFVPLTAGTPDGPEPHRLTAGDGMYFSPVVSPDGTRVAFLGSVDPTVMPHNSRVGVLSVDAVEASADQIVWASAGLDRTFACMNGGPAPSWRDDETIFAVAEDAGEQHLYALAADAAHDPLALTSGPITVMGYDAANGTIATARTSTTEPTELWVNDVQRTHLNDEFAGDVLQWERFSAPCPDGSGEVDAWIMRPADFDPEQTYPVLLNVHGGPHTQYGEVFFDEAQMQAAAGFVVVLGNPRGSSGREESWGQAIIGPKHPVKPGAGWGTVDVDDVLSILDTALNRYSFCDRDRVGMLGGSYGGFMAAWLAGKHSERFKGICCERGAINLVSMEWCSDIATAFKSYHGMTHLDDPGEYADRSPVNFAKDIDVPMLIIHSEEDWRCPIGQAEELWVALRLLDKDVDFYRFPGENHELSRAGSPVHRVQRGEIILDWFAEKLATPAG